MAIGKTGPGGHLLTAWNLADVNNPQLAAANLGLTDANGIAIGQVVFSWNSGAQNDYANGTTALLAQAVSLVGGNQYKVTLSLAFASQISAVGSGLCQVYVQDSAALIHPNVDKIKACAASSPAVGYVFSGTGVGLIAPSVNVSDTFTINVGETTSGGAMRVTANSINFLIERVA